METPELYFHISSNDNDYYRTGGQPEMRLSEPKHEQFTVEEFFDFSNHNDDNVVLSDNAATAFDNVNNNNANTTGLNSTESSSVTVVGSCNSSFSGNELPRVLNDMKGCRNFQEGNFSGDLCIPNDDLAELNQWLSDFTEDSFSSDDLQKLQLISGMNARPDKSSVAREFQPEPNNASPTFPTEIPVPGKARSKRSRPAPCNWPSRLLLLSKSRSSSSSSLDTDVISVPKKTVKVSMKKKDRSDNGPGDGRKCLHCATDKTPQWRTGPMGHKTLCNACGVRYKSGRLVPEYRPAASPTFVLTKHSNSHRKVLELRKQKEMQQRSQQQQQQHIHHHPNLVFDHLSNGEDYLIHQHMGPDFRQLI